MATNLRRLLARLDRMTDRDRTLQMIEHGRQSHSDPALAELLDQLSRGTFAERRLALIACHGSRNGAHVLRALTDPSRWIRGYAMRAVPLLCDDDQAVAALESVHPNRRRRLAVRLVHRRRRQVIDQFIAQSGRPAFERRQLLPLATEAFVSANLDLLADGSHHDWKRLAGQHPELAGRALLERVRATDAPDARLVWLINAVTERLAKHGSDAALELQRALAASIPLPSLDLQRLLPRHAVAVADLALASHDDVALTFGPAIRRLDGRRLAAVAYRLPRARIEILWHFRHLAPEVREAVYRAIGMAWRDPDGCLALDFVRWLTGVAREEEARRHLQLPALATRPARRLPYASLLGWDRARDELRRELGSPDPDIRSLALTALVGSVHYQRERAGELLDFLHQRRHEQDPVRAAFLQSLARLPPGTWQADHLSGLDRVIRDALDASDLSEASAAALTDLVVALFRRHPAWAGRALTDVARERGLLGTNDLGSRMSDHHLVHLVPNLLPVLEAWNERSRENQVIQVARCLGRRLRASGELGDLLGRLLLTTRNSAAAAGCLALLREHQPDRFADVALRLLRRDASAILLRDVADHLSRKRQDLLLPYLEPRRYAGRFSTSKATLVLSFAGGFQRWTGAQQATFAGAVETLTRRDPTRDTPTILRALRQLADLNLEPQARLVEMAASDHPALREAALRLLGGVDRLDLVLPVLLEALDDERAWVAIYALRRAILAMPPVEAVAVLSRAPLDRVTVAKEVVRLLGEVPTAEALVELRRLHGTDLHRDVRIALLRALWGHLDQPAAWEILETAAGSDDPALARSVVRIPADRLDREGQRRLVALLARLASHQDPLLRLDVAGRCAILPVPDPDGSLLGALLPLHSSRLPDERVAVGRAVFALARGGDTARVAARVRELLPDRRSLSAAVEALNAWLPVARGRLLPMARAVISELSRDPLAVPLELSVAVQALPWSELGERLRRWSADGHLDGDLFAASVTALGTTTSRNRRFDFDELAALERELARAADPRLRRLGLATLVGLSSTPGGWSAERLERLRSYRTDPSALVAGPAQFTFPPE